MKDFKGALLAFNVSPLVVKRSTTTINPNKINTL